MGQNANNNPVLVGAGQFTERLEDAGYRGLSPVEITAEAARIALADAGITQAGQGVDALYAIRTFEDSVPMLAFPFGQSNNFPQSVARRLGIETDRAVWAVSGGDSPQNLVVEACEAIARGEISTALLCGGEAMSTARHLMQSGKSADWSESIDAPVEDRGAGIDYVTGDELTNGLGAPMQFHGLIENARRMAKGKTRDEWQLEMARLFAPLSDVAAVNPFAAVQETPLSVSELASVNGANRRVVDPYSTRLIARDHVNQSASLVIVASHVADALRVPEAQRIYLHGYARASERAVSLRHDVGAAPSAGLALNAALERAGCSLSDIALFDFYSCFPVAVANAIEAIGLSPDDPRGLTITGGLPYFGAPGNNYSMHAIAEMAVRLRRRPGEFGLVAANGGFLSKYSVGVYSTSPVAFQSIDSDDLARQMVSIPTVPYSERPNGRGKIETYTLSYDRDGVPGKAIALGRLETGERFLARSARDDQETPRTMADQEPIGRLIKVSSAEGGNLFSLLSE